MDADAFVEAALARIVKNKPIVVVPVSARSLWFLHRISPALTLRVTGFLAVKVERAHARPFPSIMIPAVPGTDAAM